MKKENIKSEVIKIFDNNRNEAFNRHQLFEQLKSLDKETHEMTFVQALIELVNEDQIQPADIRGTLIYVSMACEIEALTYERRKIFYGGECIHNKNS